MNHTNENQPYCKSAIFTCNCCLYAATIYSDAAWLDAATELYCETCKGSCDRNDDTGVIYRDDIDPDMPLHMQFAGMPSGKHHCENNIQQQKIHWTDLVVQCPACEKDSMLFTNYNIGKNILEFYEQCVNQSKPAHPTLTWLNAAGDEIFVIGGTGAGFSST